ncbi:MAG TPA: DUF4276 family protein [Rhizomicrobium sp.]|nr:DUF4276 family protein [Rhizomicrobium sp.]
MTRLLIHVEGQTEETFVNEMLGPHLGALGVFASARLMGNARQRDHRGGVRGWGDVRRDIVRHLQADPSCCSTLMVDYYGMPQMGPKAWPGRAAANAVAFEQRAATVQQALFADVQAEMGADFNAARFVPFVLIHEFEALLFSDCHRFADSIGRADLRPNLQAIRDGFATPEHINDSPVTAPSKRLEQLMRRYEKPLHGVLGALGVGLNAIRGECANFGLWLGRLENLANVGP